MPIREYACPNQTCGDYGQIVERYENSSPPPAPVCRCGYMKSQLISSFGVVFTGTITARYNDSKLENAHVEGSWMYEKKAPGGPRHTFVDTWEQRKRIMKQEGLIDAGGQGAEVSSDGRKVSTAGMPGAWV